MLCSCGRSSHCFQRRSRRPRSATSRTPSGNPGIESLPDARRRADEARYQEVHVRSALTRSMGMPFKWALNPYRGCTHACEYCYARKYQRHLELNAGDDFSSLILVKRNLPEVLAARAFARRVGARNRRGRNRDRPVSADRRSLPHHPAQPGSARRGRHAVLDRDEGPDDRARRRRARAGGAVVRGARST